MRKTDPGQQNPKASALWFARLRSPILQPRKYIRGFFRAKRVEGGQFDQMGSDTCDFFSIHASELEHSDNPSGTFSAKTACEAWPLY